MNQLDLIDIYWTHQTRPKHAFSLSTNGTFTTIDISLVIRHTLLLSRPALCDPWTAAHWASWSLTVSWSFAQVRLCISDALQPSHPLMPSSPSALKLSQHPDFSSDSSFLIRWPKYWSFSFSISSSNEYSRLISLRLTGLISLLSSQESSPAPQFKGINSLVLCLYGTTCTSIRDHWGDHSLDYMDLCR